jgi:hypothetical protein
MSWAPDSEKVPIQIWRIFVGAEKYPPIFPVSGVTLARAQNLSSRCDAMFAKLCFEVHQRNYRFVTSYRDKFDFSDETLKQKALDKLSLKYQAL